MEPPQKPTTSLFDVYLRLRPSFAPNAERFLNVEESETDAPTHITIHPPANDHRKRAVEKFAFTRVFEEEAAQLDLFRDTGLSELIEGVLGQRGAEGKDGLLATLGVTGSGKSHTILGTKAQRGLTQLSLDVLFQSIGDRIASLGQNDIVLRGLSSSDASEAQMLTAGAFLELTYGDGTAADRLSRATSRAATPMMDSSFMSMPGASSKKYMPRLSNLPQYPIVEDIDVSSDPNAEYAVTVSMYEVYNDRIFDLLVGSSPKAALQKRRGLLFKSTEHSPDRKVVAGLRKVVCSSFDEAMLVLETGLTERRVAGTGSNATSSRSHGFFCVDVKKRHRGAVIGPWSNSTLTIVDLAGSERARTAKTAGATLAEAGKINESLMYLGQCMQMQSDNADMSRPQNVVPFRQCKLTELLFSNSLLSSSSHHHARRSPQKSIMIVTADPLGDFNATSQILRYSALAREVTVPRIPSVTSQMFSASTSKSNLALSGRTTPSQTQEDLDRALVEIASLRADLELVQFRLDEEISRRRAAEASWKAAEARISEVEAEVRDECWAEMEAQMQTEQRRWRAARDEEEDRRDEHVDRKLEIMAKGLVEVYEDPVPSGEQRVEELEDENARLRVVIENMKREKEVMRSPSKKVKVLKARRWEGSGLGLDGSP